MDEALRAARYLVLMSCVRGCDGITARRWDAVQQREGESSHGVDPSVHRAINQPTNQSDTELCMLAACGEVGVCV